MIPWRFLWNSILLRGGRTLLTILSIAGAVAAVVAVLQATSATRGQLDRLQNLVSSGNSLEVVSADGTELSVDTVPSLAAIPGVQRAIPLFHVFVSVSVEDRQVRGLATGVDLSEYQSLRDFRLSSGQVYSQPGEVCLEKGVAERLGVSVGDKLRLRAREVPLASTKTLVGILEFQGLGVLSEKGSLFMSLPEAARLHRATGKATSACLLLDSTLDVDDAADVIQRQLPPGLMVARGASSSELTKPTEALVNISLNVAAALSTVAAIFIVVNTFQMSVRERQRQFALFRLVGATSDQIRHVMYREATVFGVVGTVLGVGLGVEGGRVLAGGMNDLFGITSSAMPLRAVPVLGGLIFGPLVTLASVWYPARVACRTTPLAVLRSSPAIQHGIPVRLSLISGTAAMCLAVLLFAVPASGALSTWTNVGALALVQTSGVLLLPGILRPGTALLYGLVGRRMVVESRLGRCQILDHFGRSSLTVAVLFIVSASGIGIGNTILGVNGAITAWLDTTVTADFFLRASRPQVNMTETEPIPDNVEAQLDNLPGVTSIDRVTFSLISINELSATLVVREFGEYEGLPMILHDGEPTEVRRRLLEGEVVLGMVMAKKLGCRAGDRVRLRAAEIDLTLRVAGLAEEYTAGGQMVVMNRESAQQLFPISQTHVYMIRGDDQTTAGLGESLRTIARQEGLIFQSLADLRQVVREMIMGITNRLWLILALALLIAGFAIVNTLTMNVIEQTRCLGVLRVVGMTRLQVFRMFVLQALVLGLLAIVPGAVLGAVMSYLISERFSGVADYGVAFQLHLPLVCGYLCCGILLSLLAATLPAVRAGRLRPLDAIHDE